MALMSWILNKMFLEKTTLIKKSQRSKYQLQKKPQESKPLTLVLDLDETLIHSTTIKPKCGNFSTISVSQSFLKDFFS